MIKPSNTGTLEQARQVGAWLIAPFRTREAPEPPRTRVGRRAPLFAAAAAVLMLLLGGDPSVPGEQVSIPFGLPTLVAALVLGLLAWRPLIGWRIAWVATMIWQLVNVTERLDILVRVPGAVTFALVVAAVVVVVRQSRDVGWSALVWTGFLLVVGTAQTDGTAAIVFGAGLGLVGLLVDARRQRASAKAEVVSERSVRMDREAHSLVLEERARIARDLHDVVAHHMSMVAVQAETAQYRLGGVDEPVRDEFASIARSARAALNDVRGILSVLRDGEADPERAPQPTLDGLEDLVESARAVGTHVDLKIVGERRPLPTALEIGAYRIVQESLANAGRHAPGAPVDVVVTYRDRELEVTVSNGRATHEVPAPVAADDHAPRPAGHGLVGMRERTNLLRGALIAAPTSGGGFSVTAVLPVEETAA